MRRKARPFIVEVKKSKRTPVTGETISAPPQTSPSSWLAAAGDLDASPRRVAERPLDELALAVFGAPRPAAEPAVPAVSAEESLGATLSSRRRILPDLTVKPPEPPVVDEVEVPAEPVRRRGRPRRVPLADMGVLVSHPADTADVVAEANGIVAANGHQPVADETGQAMVQVAEPRMPRRRRVETSLKEAEPIFMSFGPDEPVEMEIPAAIRTAEAALRRHERSERQQAMLPRGQRWKRRLPTACW